MSERRKRGGAAAAGGDAPAKGGRGKSSSASAAAAAANNSMDDADEAPSSSSAAAAGTAAAASSSSASAPSTSAGATATPAAAAPVVGSKRPGAKSIRANDQKRKKLVPRCSSPSHFLLDNAGGDGSSSGAGVASLLSSPLPSALSSDPSAPAASKCAESSSRIDGFLHSIGSMYYRNHASLSKDPSAAGGNNGGAAEVWVAADYDKLEYPTLDLLLSPLRKANVLDNWCPREIALFEAGICAVGKDFHAIANLITTKSCKECVDFYYCWKKSSHYALWKNFGKPSKKPHANKEEQWRTIREQMRGGGEAGAAPPASATSAVAANAATAGVKKEA